MSLVGSNKSSPWIPAALTQRCSSLQGTNSQPPPKPIDSPPADPAQALLANGRPVQYPSLALLNNQHAAHTVPHPPTPVTPDLVLAASLSLVTRSPETASPPAPAGSGDGAALASACSRMSTISARRACSSRIGVAAVRLKLLLASA